MIERFDVISQALLLLGNVVDYNDNRSRKFQAANVLLDNTISTICNDNAYRFNAVTSLLTSAKNNGLEYVFNLPTDFLGIATGLTARNRVTSKPVSIQRDMSYAVPQEYRIEGDNIISNRPELKINYIRMVKLEDFPLYMKDVLIFNLAVKCCLAFPEFVDRLGYCEQKYKEARNVVLNKEGLGVVYEH